MNIKKILDWGKRWGYMELLKKPFLILFAPLIVKMHPCHIFKVNDTLYDLFYHRYNLTWTKERAVEIPYAIKEIESCKGNVLEVGNVMSHYFNPTWSIVDKYEIADGVINEDINTYKPKNKFDLIIAISTFEHIGWDEDGEPDPFTSSVKIMESFNNLKNNCLNKKGRIVISIPIGWNPAIDKLFLDNAFNFKRISYVARVGDREWVQTSKDKAMTCVYGKPYPYANCIAIGEFQND